MRLKRHSNRDILIDLTSLLDVIFIILLVVFANQRNVTNIKQNEQVEAQILLEQHDAEATEAQAELLEQIDELKAQSDAREAEADKQLDIAQAALSESEEQMSLKLAELQAENDDKLAEMQAQTDEQLARLQSETEKANAQYALYSDRIDTMDNLNRYVWAVSVYADYEPATVTERHIRVLRDGEEIEQFDLVGNDTKEAFAQFKQCLEDYIDRNSNRPVILSLNENDEHILYRDEQAILQIFNELSDYGNVYLK